MSTTSRRTRWHPTPPPPPSPKILNFPRSRRTRRKQPKPITQQYHHNDCPSVMHQDYLSSDKGKLEKLFDRENDNELPVVLLNSNSNASEVEKRVRVEGECNGGGFEEEKWRFQAEILRAECNFLRMEREFALRKLERNRVKMERTLRSAVQTLVSGKEKIFEGKNVNAVLEEEIEDLEEKLEELQKSSKIKDHEVRNCSNFDKKASLFQRRLEKLGGLSEESFSKELQELAESSLSIKENCELNLRTKNKCADMDVLRKKMEGLSKGMLDRVEEEYASILSSTANSSVASSASTSKRIYQCPEFSNFSTRQLYQQEQTFQDENKCSGRCKAIIHKIVEQVRAETEQWSQMQEMLGQVRGEMEELRKSRDFWENRALNSDYEIQSLRHSVEEWKEKALGFENKANELQHQLSSVKEELQNREAMAIPLATQLENEKGVLSCCLKENHFLNEKGCAFENAIKELNAEQNKEQARNKDLPPLSLGKHLAKEKRMLLRRLKETRHASNQDRKQEPLANERRQAYTKGNGILESTRSPLQDIGNSSFSPLARQHSKAVLSFLSPENRRMREKP